MDIVGLLPITESEHSYIFTIQDLLTKFSGGATQEGNVSEDSRSTRRKVYQPIYCAESMDHGSRTEFYKQSDATHST